MPMNLHKRPIERVTGNKAVRLVSDNIKIFDYLADRVMASPYPTKKKEQLMSTLMKGMHITDPFLFKRFVTIFKSSIEMDDPFPDMTAISLGDLFIATIRNRLIKKNKNWISIVEGETGSGKSTVAITQALAIDPTFNEERIIFSPKDFLYRVKDLKRGQVIMWDETGVGFSSQDFAERVSKYISKVFQTMRFKNGATIMTVPMKGMINVNARRLVHSIEMTNGISRNYRINYVKMYKYAQSLFTNKAYSKLYRFNFFNTVFALKRIAFVRPKMTGVYGKIFKEYEKKKQEFFDATVIGKAVDVIDQEESISRSERERRKWQLVEQSAREVINNPSTFGYLTKNGNWKLSVTSIEARFKVGTTLARLISEKAKMLLNKSEGG